MKELALHQLVQIMDPKGIFPKSYNERYYRVVWITRYHDGSVMYDLEDTADHYMNQAVLHGSERFRCLRIFQ